MAKLGREKARMTAFHKRQGKAAQTELRKLGKSMSRSARSSKKVMGGSNKRKGSGSTAERHPAVPLSPEALKVRVVAVVVAVVGSLLSLVITPLGSLLFVAGIVAAVLARRIAGWIYGGGRRIVRHLALWPGAISFAWGQRALPSGFFGQVCHTHAVYFRLFSRLILRRLCRNIQPS